MPCSEVQQCKSASLRRKDVCGLKLRCRNVKVVVLFCGHLSAAEEQVSVVMLGSYLWCQILERTGNQEEGVFSVLLTVVMTVRLL